MYQEKWRPFDGLLQKPVHIHRICGEIARQGRRFTQLLLVAAVFNHMHKRGNGALWGTVGWQPGFTKQTPCLLRGEFAAPVGQQGNVFTAGMVSDRLNQRTRTFAAGATALGEWIIISASKSRLSSKIVIALM